MFPSPLNNICRIKKIPQLCIACGIFIAEFRLDPRLTSKPRPIKTIPIGWNIIG